MRVGMTYDLRDDYLARGYSVEATAELDRQDTIDGIAQALRELGHDPVRIGNIFELTRCLVNGERWDLVFNIAEGMHGPSRESQVPALLEAYQIPCTFSDSLVLALALNKAVTKRIVGAAGIATPDFVEVRCAADIAPIRLPLPLFAKPVAEGSSKGISSVSRINTAADLAQVCGNLLEQYRQPVLVETYLPGREFTVGVVGTGDAAEVLGVMEIHFTSPQAAETYSYFTKTHYEELVKYSLADGEVARECTRLALAVWRVLGCRDGGRVDVRLAADGQANFLEVNPLPGLNYVYSDLPILCGLRGIPFRDLIGKVITSACRRNA